MLDVKFKNNTKFKICGKSDYVRNRSSSNVMHSSVQKTGYRDYINEIFAGLIWLG